MILYGSFTIHKSTKSLAALMDPVYRFVLPARLWQTLTSLGVVIFISWTLVTVTEIDKWNNEIDTPVPCLVQPAALINFKPILYPC
jgi:hypothetical protein